MSIHGHRCTIRYMKVSTSKFRAQMGRYMRAARTGRQVVLTDRGEPVARLVPYESPPAADAVQIAQPRDPGAPPLGELMVRAVEAGHASATQMLLEDRRRR